MTVSVTAKHVELTDGLHTFIQNHIGKLAKYFPDKLQGIRVVVDIDRKRKGVAEDAIVELVGDLDGRALVVRETGKTFYLAFFGAVAKFKKRIRREHDRRTS